MRTEEKSSAPAGRAWRMLRLALLCARRGSQRIVSDIQRGLSRLKSLRAERSCRSYRLHYYGEHELSFDDDDDDTSTFPFKRHRRRRLLPCIDPPLVSFDDEEDDISAGSSVQVREESARNGDGDGGEDNKQGGEENYCVDSKAEEFVVLPNWEKPSHGDRFPCLGSLETDSHAWVRWRMGSP